MTVLSFPAPVITLFTRLATAVSVFSISNHYLTSWSHGPTNKTVPGLVRKHHTASSAVSRTEAPATHEDSKQSSNVPPSSPKRTPPEPSPKHESKSDELIHRLLHNPVLYDPLRTPRHPIVLCHGLYGFDVRGPSSFPLLQMHYWSNVLNILRHKVGAEVIVTSVPPTGAIAERAENLHRLLLEKAPGRDINFLAHSMGGLDCRHVISTIKPKEYTPASLTTVSTPHRGSPFMDWCAEYIGLGKLGKQTPSNPHSPSSSLDPSTSTPSAAEVSAQAAENVKSNPSTSQLLGALPSSFTTYLLGVLDEPAYGNLTTHYLRDVFNPATPDSPSVKYFSVAGRTESVSVWHPFWFTKLVLDAWERKERQRLRDLRGVHSRDPNPDKDADWGNDGLVAVQSAKWGEFLGTLEGTDHWEIRGARGLELDIDLTNVSLPLKDWDWSRFKGWGGALALGIAGGNGSLSEPDLEPKDRMKVERQEHRTREREARASARHNRQDGGVDEGDAKVATVEPTQNDPPTKGGVIHVRDKRDAEKEQDEGVKRSAERLGAVFDWIVEHVPTDSISKLSSGLVKGGSGDIKQNLRQKEKEGKKAERHDLARKEDLERFYVALARKLYDEGL